MVALCHPFQIHDDAIYKLNFGDFILMSNYLHLSKCKIVSTFDTLEAASGKVSRMCPLVHPSSGSSTVCRTPGSPEHSEVLLHLFFFFRNLNPYCKMCSSALSMGFVSVIMLIMWKIKNLCPTV